MMEAVGGVLLAAFATSLGWGLRGEWGHWWGATVPGAFCGMSIWLAFGQRSDVWQMVIFGAVLAVSLSLGGTLSYAKIVGYVKKEHDRSPAFGLFGLFLVGGLWGFFGGVGLGLLMSDLEYDLVMLAFWALLAAIGAYLAYKLLVLGLDLHLSPPRSDAWAAVLGGAIATTIFFGFVRSDLLVLRTACLGWAGFGGGFSLGALIHRYFVRSQRELDSWKFMEHSVGFWGGLSMGVSVVIAGGDLAPVPASDAGLLASALLVFWLVPYMNISNNFEHWLKERWMSRGIFAAYQAAALAVMIALIWLLDDLLEWWQGSADPRILCLLFMAFLTLMGIAKFKFSRMKVRLLVDAGFIGSLLACGILLLVV